MMVSATTAIGEVSLCPSYNRARYYNPNTGRFLSEDPAGFRGGINKYAYAGDSPTNFIDPSGNDKKDPCKNATDSLPGANVIKFLSLYNLATDFKNAWPDWTVLPAGKILALEALKGASNAIGGTEALSVTGGTSTVIGGSVAAAIDAGEATLGPLGIPSIALANYIDLMAHASCTAGPEASFQNCVPVDSGPDDSNPATWGVTQ